MREIGAVVFEGFELLDLYGPLEMFGLLPDHFRIEVLAMDAGPVGSGMGPRAAVDAPLAGAAPDILLVPGGPGTRREVGNPALLDALAAAAGGAEIVASVCTGAALLARAGLLEGRRATTNKNAFDWVASQGPETDWRRRARWVEDGRFWTSSGVSAGIDMSLALIARLAGGDAAREAARNAEYTANTDPSNDPFARGDPS